MSEYAKKFVVHGSGMTVESAIREAACVAAENKMELGTVRLSIRDYAKLETEVGYVELRILGKTVYVELDWSLKQGVAQLFVGNELIGTLELDR